MKAYELVIVWATGDRDVYPYRNREEAEIGERNMKMALGEQISWSCVRPAQF